VRYLFDGSDSMVVYADGTGRMHLPNDTRLISGP
jgi:hypothetical protein